MSAIIVHWQKTGTIEAHVETESGTVIRCHDYTAAADATLEPGASVVLSGVGFGASSITSATLARLARAQIAAIDEEVAQAERDADDLLAAWARHLAVDNCVRRGDLCSPDDETDEERRQRWRADHAVRRRMTPAFGLALWRRGFVVVFGYEHNWAVMPTEQAALYTAAIAFVSTIKTGILYYRAPQPLVDVPARMRAAWTTILQEHDHV